MIHDPLCKQWTTSYMRLLGICACDLRKYVRENNND